MKLYYSPASPYVRKVVVCAAELGIELERLPSAASPVNRDRTVMADNPLAKVPTLVADDGTALYDSRVICEYLDGAAGGGRLFPTSGAARWRALVEQALGDGLLDAALLARYETMLRPTEKQWEDWRAGQMDKIRTALDKIQDWAPGLGERVDIGTITLGCALGYLDFRFADYDWRSGRGALAAWYESFAKRPSMQATMPRA